MKNFLITGLLLLTTFISATDKEYQPREIAMIKVPTAEVLNNNLKGHSFKFDCQKFIKEIGGKEHSPLRLYNIFRKEVPDAEREMRIKFFATLFAQNEDAIQKLTFSGVIEH
jgi:hypothetical protein